MSLDDPRCGEDSTRETVFRALGTVAQLLVVVGILVLLVGLCGIRVLNVRDSPRLQSQNNLKQMCLGLDQMVSPNDSPMPPTRGSYPTGGPNATLFFHLLPEIEQDRVYQWYKTDPINGPMKAQVRIRMYQNPVDPTYPDWNTTLISYAANASVFGFTDGGTARLSKMSKEKGTSNTVLFMERYAVVGVPGTRHTWCGRGDLENYLYPSGDPEKMALPEFGVPANVASNDTPHCVYSKQNTTIVGLADGSVRSITRDMTRTFTCTDGKTATIWAWACSYDGPLAKEPAPPGW